MELDQPTIAPDYYLKNFHFLVDWVWERYRDLLNAEETQFVQRFHQLSRPAQCLLVRLISRKGPWFRCDKITYAEIPALNLALRELIDAQMACDNKHLPIEQLGSLLTKAELLTVFSQELQSHKNDKKDVLITQLLNSYSAHNCTEKHWREWTHQQWGDLVYLDHQKTLSNFLVLFFGNSHQDLTEFVLQDLGLFRYENYPIDKNYRVFTTRDELDLYQQLTHWRDLLEQPHELSLLLSISDQLPSPPIAEKIKRRYAKLCNHIAYILEQQGHYDYAERLYRQSHLPPSRERRIRLLEKQGYFTEAWNLLQQLINAPLNEQEQQVAQRIAPRVAKKLGIETNKQTKTTPIEIQKELKRLLDDTQHPLSVEEITRLHIDTAEAPCIYAENSLFMGLFGLWLWPEMFRGLDGAFANPFQAAPLDLYQEDFVARRQGIKTLWESLENGSYKQAIIDTWEQKYGRVNLFVNWNFLSKERLELALNCISAAHLRVIFQRLLFDIKANRSGLPDLIQFFPAEQGYKLIEVKGPGDKIQDNQARWLAYFATHQIPAEVHYIRWQGDIPNAS